MTNPPHQPNSFGAALFALAALILPAVAHAHVGVGETAGFARGFEHPLGGIDHVWAMVAVGLWAAQRGGRALWLIPATFVVVMALGGVTSTLGVFVPFVEQGIVLSVLVLGVLIAAAVRLPLLASALIVGLFGVFHGYAHGAEIPASVSGFSYGGGFALTTALLHGLGIGGALLTRRAGQTRLVQVSGGAISAFGLYLWLVV